jgi:hypothetical protein
VFQPPKSWVPLALVTAAALTTGYVLARPEKPEKRGGDILAAVAAVERRCSLHLIPERGRPHNWVTDSGFYLCRSSQDPVELDRLIKDPRQYDERWYGIVYFKACARRTPLFLSFLPCPEDKILQYSGFAVYGDPELIQTVRSILGDEGFETIGS